MSLLNRPRTLPARSSTQHRAMTLSRPTANGAPRCTGHAIQIEECRREAGFIACSRKLRTATASDKAASRWHRDWQEAPQPRSPPVAARCWPAGPAAGSKADRRPCRCSADAARSEFEFGRVFASSRGTPRQATAWDRVASRSNPAVRAAALARRLLPARRRPAEPAAHKPVARAAAGKPADQSQSPDSLAAVARRLSDWPRRTKAATTNSRWQSARWPEPRSN
jgi:hypothetical protein